MDTDRRTVRKGLDERAYARHRKAFWRHKLAQAESETVAFVETFPGKNGGIWA